MKRLFLTLCLVALSMGIGSAQKMRVMSYNVRNCLGMDNVFDFDRTATVLKEAKPDVVALQELDSMTTRNNHYVLGELAKRMGYHDYFAPAIKFRGGKYGIGVLSKKPALSVATYPLPCRREPRTMIVVEFDKYYFICTHLSLNETDRLSSVKIIRDVVAKLNKPVFLVGDINALPNSRTTKAFLEFMQALSDTTQYTYKSTSPSKCIDYIYGCGAKFVRPRTTVIKNSVASDHMPLYVDLKIKKK